MDVYYDEEEDEYGEHVNSERGAIGEVDRLLGIGFFAVIVGVVFFALKFALGMIVKSENKRQQSTNLGDDAKIQW